MKVLVISIPGIGNTLLITPMLKALKDAGQSVGVLVKLKGSYQLLENSKYVDKLLLLPKKGLLSFLFRLRREKYDISITAFPANDIRYNLLAMIIGAEKRITHNYTTKRFRTLLFLQNLKVKIEEVHDIEQSLNLLKPLELRSNSLDKFPFIELSAKNRKFANDFLAKNNIGKKNLIVGIHAGSSKGSGMYAKQWPKEHFAEVIKHLVNKKAKVILFSGPEEEGLCKEIEAMAGVEVAKAIGFHIKDVAAVAEKCKLFVSNDSGVMHIASAMNVPVIAIFGSTDPVRTRPYGDIHTVVKLNLPCMPCNHAFHNLGLKFKCDNDFACLRKLKPEMVIRAIERKLRVMQKSGRQ